MNGSEFVGTLDGTEPSIQAQTSGEQEGKKPRGWPRNLVNNESGLNQFSSFGAAGTAKRSFRRRDKQIFCARSCRSAAWRASHPPVSKGDLEKLRRLNQERVCWTGSGDRSEGEDGSEPAEAAVHTDHLFLSLSAASSLLNL
jgi:hypothetical protein